MPSSPSHGSRSTPPKRPRKSQRGTLLPTVEMVETGDGARDYTSPRARAAADEEECLTAASSFYVACSTLIPALIGSSVRRAASVKRSDISQLAWCALGVAAASALGVAVLLLSSGELQAQPPPNHAEGLLSAHSATTTSRPPQPPPSSPPETLPVQPQHETSPPRSLPSPNPCPLAPSPTPTPPALSQPAESPSQPPPYLLMGGPLSAEKCNAMFSDKAGLFRKMWAAHPFVQRQHGQPNCWDVARDAPDQRQNATNFFLGAFRGYHCNTNWYSGNPGPLGKQGASPSFTGDAPALLGFDETIDEYCGSQPIVNEAASSKKEKDEEYGGFLHARRCIASNLNILSLYGDRIPYNICRNLECAHSCALPHYTQPSPASGSRPTCIPPSRGRWQICAARGKLSWQGRRQIIFSRAPKELDPSPTGSKPFQMCRGWRPKGSDSSCENGYGTDGMLA